MTDIYDTRLCPVCGTYGAHYRLVDGWECTHCEAFTERSAK